MPCCIMCHILTCGILSICCICVCIHFSYHPSTVVSISLFSLSPQSAAQLMSPHKSIQIDYKVRFPEKAQKPAMFFSHDSLFRTVTFGCKVQMCCYNCDFSEKEMSNIKKVDFLIVWVSDCQALFFFLSEYRKGRRQSCHIVYV